MATDKARQDELLSDEELIERARANPEVRARGKALVEKVKAGEFKDRPGIRGQKLTDFLRELRRELGG
jgi:hypothetical protein